VQSRADRDRWDLEHRRNLGRRESFPGRKGQHLAFDVVERSQSGPNPQLIWHSIGGMDQQLAYLDGQALG